MPVEVRRGEEGRVVALNQSLLVRLGRNPEHDDIAIRLPRRAVDGVGSRVAEEDERLAADLVDDVVSRAVTDCDMRHLLGKLMNVTQTRPWCLVRHLRSVPAADERVGKGESGQARKGLATRGTGLLMGQTGWVGVLGRAGRRTNVALLAVLGAAFASGCVAFGVGTMDGARLVAVVHGALGLGLLLLVPWKSVIIRRGLARPSSSRDRTAGVALGVLLLLSLCAGVLHAVTGYRGVAGISALAVHVGAAAIALPFLLIHVRGRRQWMRRSDLSRRTLLRAGAFGVGSLAAYATLAASTSLLALPGRQRRPTGSYQIGSGDPDAMPVTQWFTDTVPALSPATWEVSLSLDRIPYSDLAAGRDTVRAVLDCTGGWYAEQEWRGVALSRLLKQVPAGTQSIDVISSTGYRRRLPLADLDHLLLATHAAGKPLSEGHGGPVRLVAPGRRGFWWVKWVQRIEVTAEPWWLQPPFPLQ